MITELDSYFLLLKTLLYSGLIYCILLEKPPVANTPANCAKWEVSLSSLPLELSLAFMFGCVEGVLFRCQRPLHSYCSGLSLMLVWMGHFLERQLASRRSQL